jgi:chemotaxis protein MotB
MARKKKEHPHENHERWLVSYADFITLLFAFFVVMFASSQADKSKAKAVSEAVREALEHGQLSNAVSTALGRGRHETKKAPITKDPANKEEIPKLPDGPPDGKKLELTKPLETLKKGLEQELASGKVQVQLTPRGLVISLREAAFFASGDSAVQPASFPIMQKIASAIQPLPNPMRLEGHTDAVPIHNSRFRSNWELSSARSIAVLDLFSGRYQIAMSRMSVAGYGENAPVDSNETEEGRAHNRRVDVVVLSAEALKTEPH